MFRLIAISGSSASAHYLSSKGEYEAMPDPSTSETPVAGFQKFVCDSLPIPPGAKAKAKLPRGEDILEESSYLKWWLLGGGAVTVALVVGVVIGRFLLP